MVDFLRLLAHVLVLPFKSQARLEAEIVVLRHQLNVLRRGAPSKLRLTPTGRLMFVWLLRVFSLIRSAIQIVQPETVVRWHRLGFRLYWRWKSRSRGGWPRISAEVHKLIRDMSLANPLWDAPRLHGELLKLGIAVAQSTVAKYMAKTGRGPSQTWKTFLRNHNALIMSSYSVKRHLRRILAAYRDYYNEVRTHLSVAKDAPGHRPIQRLGPIIARPILGGLHHQYGRT